MLTLFVDESGDEGIHNVRSAVNQNGASPWFFFGAFLLSSENTRAAQAALRECRERITRDIHFSSLTHEKKVFCCKKFSELPITIFGLISDKSGLDRGNYRSTLDHQKFYNKNAKYLLEKVGKFCELNNCIVDQIIFEKKNGHNYDQMRNFIRSVRDNPIYTPSRNLIHLNISKLREKTKAEEPLLKIADAISNSLFSSCTPNIYDLTEHRYIKEMKSKFFCSDTGQILDYGLKIVPSLNALQISASDLAFLRSFANIDQQQTSLQSRNP